jgi:3'(2'), 5'-bisphosphate nucleotidase
MSPTIPLARLLDEAGQLARRAGQAILATRVALGDVEIKDDGSPVTRAELAAHEVILAGLAQLTPEIPVISEEGELETAVRAAGSSFWLVDPLDGTKEFIKGLPEYTVNIALVENGEPVLGAIHVPAVDVLYLGARGVGARRVDPHGTLALETPSVTCPRRAVASRSHLSLETEEFLRLLGIGETAPRGSSLKLCAVAEGAADVYPRLAPTRLWDTAAGTAIARAAGCHVIDLAGEPLRYDLAKGLVHPGFVVCAPGSGLSACRAALASLAMAGRGKSG